MEPPTLSRAPTVTNDTVLRIVIDRPSGATVDGPYSDTLYRAGVRAATAAESVVAFAGVPKRKRHVPASVPIEIARKRTIIRHAAGSMGS
jgi:hypothetical protein